MSRRPRSLNPTRRGQWGLLWGHCLLEDPVRSSARDRGVVPRLHLVTPGVSGLRGAVLAILWDDSSQKWSSDLSSSCCSALHGLGELEHVALLLGACLFILDGGHSHT